MATSAVEHRRTRVPGKIDIRVPAAGLPVAGVSVWLAARKETTYSDGNEVATWHDFSGGGHDASQAGATLKPLYKTGILNGQAVMRFDGSNDTMSLGDLSAVFTSAATLFIVATTPDTAYNLYTSHNNTDADVYYRFAADGHGYYGPFRTGRYTAWPSTMPSSGTHLWVLKTQTGTGTYVAILDNVSKGTQTTTFAGGNAHALSFNKYLAGDIAEVILFNTYLSASDVDTIEAYLNSLYAIY